MFCPSDGMKTIGHDDMKCTLGDVFSALFNFAFFCLLMIKKRARREIIC